MDIVVQLLHLLAMLLFVEAIISWVVPNPHQFPRNYLSKLTDPLYTPTRRLLDPQRTGGFDLSPLIWIIGLQILANVLANASRGY